MSFFSLSCRCKSSPARTFSSLLLYPLHVWSHPLVCSPPRLSLTPRSITRSLLMRSDKAGPPECCRGRGSRKELRIEG